MSKNKLIDELWKILNNTNLNHKDRLNEIKELLVKGNGDE
jgi:hypothetical protein